MAGGNAQSFQSPLVGKSSDARTGRVLDTITANQPRPGYDMLSTPMPGGVILNSARGRRASTSTPKLPLQVLASGIVVPGTVLYAMPTIGGTPLNAATPPSLIFSGSGTEHVVVQVSGSLDVVDGSFVRPILGGVSASIAIASDPGYAGMVSSSGVFRFVLATFVDGVKTMQNGHGPITGELCDDLSGSARAVLTLTYASA